MEISWDIIFFIIISLIILTCYCQSTDEKFDNIANADIEAIRNLNSIAAKLTAGQLTSPGPLSVTGDLNIGPGNKFKFNPGGDNWVRLLNANGSHADQGFAATRLWTQNLHGKPTVVDGIAGNLNVDGVITAAGRNLLGEIDSLKGQLNDTINKLNNLTNTTVKKDQRFSLQQTNTWSGGNNTWYKIAMSDACILRAINAGCGGDNWGDNNNFRILQ